MELFSFFSLRIHREYGNGARRGDAYGMLDSTSEIKAARRDDSGGGATKIVRET